MRIWNHLLLLRLFKISGIFYKSPSNFNYWYNFGFIASFFLLFQIITGIVLAMFYNANIELSFGIVLSTTTEIYYGWWLRSLHSNGASFFFLVVYIHMARGIYYGSYVYPRQLLWVSGAALWLLMIATAFLGYILPWGQMSFWGAMVITNLLGSIPFVGGDLVYLLWGGFSIGNATLQRFYSLHYMLPFLLIFITCLHFILLHEYGSNNPLGISSATDSIPFIPYYGIKDIFSILIILIFFLGFIFYYPDLLGHSDNYIEANALVTPAHIVPEWYFLPLYAVLRSVPNKLFGVFLILLFIVCIFLLPFYSKPTIRSGAFRPFYSMIIWIFFFVCILLGWIGGLPVIYPFYELGQLFTFSYFFILLIVLPLLNRFDRYIYIAYIQKKSKFRPNFSDQLPYKISYKFILDFIRWLLESRWARERAYLELAQRTWGSPKFSYSFFLYYHLFLKHYDYLDSLYLARLARKAQAKKSHKSLWRKLWELF